MRADRNARDPAGVEQTYLLSPGVYLIGSLEDEVTVYRQQIRAHNLAWAFHAQGKTPKNIAIIGGGITGLTAAACMLALMPNARLTLFEKRWDLCALQLGCDTRWLHPKIYDWPNFGSRGPSAQLPVLNWSEGRASDVARNIRRGFSAYSKAFEKRLSIYLGLRHIQVTAADRSIQWTGVRVSFNETFNRLSDPEVKNERFDLIVAAPGYRLERRSPRYWENEKLAQPLLTGGRATFLISGFGDGAIVDLCRLTIAGFRQDTILKDLFGPQLEQIENEVLARKGARNADYFRFLDDEIFGLIEHDLENLRRRLRQDTAVILQLAGRHGNHSFADVFDHSSSFLNKFLLFALFKCGAFTTSFADLDSTQRDFLIPESNIILRHGSEKPQYVRDLFVDPTTVEPGITNIANQQSTDRLWSVGIFPRPGVDHDKS
jgi:hypothetical protein